MNYPRLSRMAIDLLSIPAMSAESERVLSGARRTITWERHNLGSKVVEESECMKSWIRLLIQDGDEGLSTEIAQQVLEAGDEQGGLGEGSTTVEQLELMLGIGVDEDLADSGASTNSAV